MAHNETFNFEYNSGREYNSSVKHNSGREYNSSVKYNSGREYNSSVKHNSGREYNSNTKHKFVPSTFSAATHRPRYKIYNPEGVESTDLTYGKLTTAFLSRTGGFGYPEILDSRRGVKKTFWILLTVACCCALFVHTYSLISRFSQFPVTTEVTVVNTKILDFPAVTICNSNMLAVHSPANTSNTSFDYKNARTVNNQINYLKLNNSQLGHQKEDFILSATFNSIPLALDDFELSLHGLYGNCFTFNANGSAQVRRSVHGFYGLELVLNIETYKYYMGPLTYPLDFAAAWLKVSKPGAAFKIEEMSVAVSPNTINILSIHQTNFARLGVPYGDCFREDDPKPLLYQKNKSYDKDLCDNTCLQRAVILECCCYISIIETNIAEFDESWESCRRDNITECATDNMCLAEMWAEYDSGNLPCTECLPLCSDVLYEVSADKSKWPLETFTENVILHELKAFDQLMDQLNNFSISLDADFVTDNLVKVQLNFASMTTSTVTELPQISPWEFASELGSAFGLWIGWSAWTLFHLIEYLSDSVALSVQRRRRSD